MRKALALLLLLPSLSYATDLPKWKVMGDFACYDFEGAKSLKLFENDCQRREAEANSLRKELTDLHLVVGLQNNTVSNLKETQIELEKALTRTQMDRDRCIKDKAPSQGRAAWISALPWVLTGVAVAFVGGIYVGVKYSN